MPIPDIFYVRNNPKDERDRVYVAARVLRDKDGVPITFQSSRQAGYNTYDAPNGRRINLYEDYDKVDEYVGGFVIVPANFDLKRALAWAKSTADNNGAVKEIKFFNAFKPGGWLDLQTNWDDPNAPIAKPDEGIVPAFRTGASYVFGMLGKEAGIRLDRLHEGGGIVNTVQYWRGKVEKEKGKFRPLQLWRRVSYGVQSHTDIPSRGIADEASCPVVRACTVGTRSCTGAISSRPFAASCCRAQTAKRAQPQGPGCILFRRPASTWQSTASSRKSPRASA
jgi:hypothetical protein